MDFEKNVKKFRLQEGFSLQKLSKLSGISVTALSAIERGEKSPTLRTMSQIAEALNTTVSELLSESSEREVHLIKREEHAVLTDPISGIQRRFLFPALTSRMQFCLSKIPPRTTTGELPQHRENTKEYIVVSRGNLTVILNKKHIYELHQGDSLYFTANVTHQFSNSTDDECEFYSIEEFPLKNPAFIKL